MQVKFKKEENQFDICLFNTDSDEELEPIVSLNPDLE